VRSYDSQAIEVLTGLEPVRKRPGMFTETDRPNHLAQEVVDNSIDEVIAGHATNVAVTLHGDGSLSVVDNGRGMPVDKHRKEGVSGVEVILTRLHAGGKFNRRSYRFAGGLHGVGVSVVNALSKRLAVVVHRGGAEYQMQFKHGKKAAPLKVTGKVAKKDTGTAVRFWPDPEFFDNVNFDVRRLKRVLRAKAVLCPQLSVAFTDEARPGNSETWQYEDGLREYLGDMLDGAVTVPAQAVVCRDGGGRGEGEAEEVEWAAAWTDGGGACFGESYVNLIPTAQGGTHVNGFRGGLTDALREFCEYRDLAPRGVRIGPDDVAGRLNYVLSVRAANPQFAGQAKERLSSRETGVFVANAVRDGFSLWLNKNAAEARRIAEVVIAHAMQRMRDAKKVERKKTGAGPALPGKLADCTSRDAERGELFLVEGDSAGGSAKQAREREFQAILPLRGKILNTWEVDSQEVLASREVHDIAIALGVDPGGDISGLRYGKVCILADADSDGAHIAALLCALFVRHFPRLVEAGRIHVAMPPLYRVDAGREVFYALDEDEKERVLARIAAQNPRAKINVQRFKGLGEMNPAQLRETAMLPATRRLVRLTVNPDDDTFATLGLLLAKKNAGQRRAWLERRGGEAQL